MGASESREKKLICWGLGLSSLYSLGFFMSLDKSISSLYDLWGSKKVLAADRYIDDFCEIIRGKFRLFGIFAIIMLALCLMHYLSHFSGSRSIYLMRRLPQRWELLKRCVTVPLMGIVLCVILMVILTAIYFGAYMVFTPKGHILPGQFSKLLASIWR
jgi:hypothetical protein